jgi:hypothetical protein
VTDEAHIDPLIEQILAAVGADGLTALRSASDDRIDELLEPVRAITSHLRDEQDRHEHALRLIEMLIPNMVDVKLWRDVAVGKNIDLPASDMYGHNPESAKPASPRVGSKAPYGKVHDKTARPSQFIARQGDYLAARARRIAELERQLNEEKQRFEEVQSGLSVFAMTALLTEVRKAAAPIFAMGPAWTILRSIAGDTGTEPNPNDVAAETQRIMVVLHALIDHVDFQRALKRSILAVCHQYQGEAHRRGKDAWSGPFDYDEILAKLGWPDLEAS